LETVEGTAAEIGVVTYGDSTVPGRATVPAGRECESDYDRGIEKAVQLREPDLEQKKRTAKVPLARRLLTATSGSNGGLRVTHRTVISPLLPKRCRVNTARIGFDRWREGRRRRELALSPDSARLDGLREIGNAGDLSLVPSLIFLGEIPRSLPGPARKIILSSADSGEKGIGIPGGGRQFLLRPLNRYTYGRGKRGFLHPLGQTASSICPDFSKKTPGGKSGLDRWTQSTFRSIICCVPGGASIRVRVLASTSTVYPRLFLEASGMHKAFLHRKGLGYYIQGT